MLPEVTQINLCHWSEQPKNQHAQPRLCWLPGVLVKVCGPRVRASKMKDEVGEGREHSRPRKRRPSIIKHPSFHAPASLFGRLIFHAHSSLAVINTAQKPGNRHWNLILSQRDLSFLRDSNPGPPPPQAPVMRSATLSSPGKPSR